MSKLWGGRFEKEIDRDVMLFSSSLDVDRRLWAADLAGSRAHARMLGAQGILSAADAENIIAGLNAVEADFRASLERGADPFGDEHEDIHSLIESRLTEKIGTVAGRLHTARSRNDQVATAFRFYLANETRSLIAELERVQRWIVTASAKETETLLPGLTHFQHAQPVSLAHHLLAYFWMFDRDRERLTEGLARTLQLPLGSAALAGTGFPIDREQVAKELNFAGLCENSLDAVSDRDFAIEFISDCSILLMHLSRLCEEIIIWTAPEHGFMTLDDSVTTGSSIMPQKKNPDMAELIRGRTGRVFGALMASLTMMKGLPLAYNRDLQEDKALVFQALDTAVSSVRLMRAMLETAQFHRERMAASLEGDFSNATDLADDLALKGVPFRQAHEISGRIVRFCLEEKRALESLSVTDLKKFHESCDEATRAKLSHRAVMEARTSRGGTSPKSVREQIERAQARLG